MDLKTLLTPERVVTGVHAANWEEAVRASGQVLLDTGAIEPRYIDGMVNTTRELGAYIVIAPGLAIPHSRPEDGVLEPCMAVVKLADPVEFGNEDNDPVKTLIAFGVVDSNQHVEALQQMAEILSDPANFEALQNAESREEILSILWGGSGGGETQG